MNVDAGMMKMGIRTNLNMWCHNPVFLQIIARFRTPPNFLLLESFAKENSYWALKLSTFHHRAVNLKTNSINLFEVSFYKGSDLCFKSVYKSDVMQMLCSEHIESWPVAWSQHHGGSSLTVHSADTGTGVTPQQIDSG